MVHGDEWQYMCQKRPVHIIFAQKCLPHPFCRSRDILDLVGVAEKELAYAHLLQKPICKGEKDKKLSPYNPIHLKPLDPFVDLTLGPMWSYIGDELGAYAPGSPKKNIAFTFADHFSERWIVSKHLPNGQKRMSSIQHVRKRFLFRLRRRCTKDPSKLSHHKHLQSYLSAKRQRHRSNRWWMTNANSVSVTRYLCSSAMALLVLKVAEGARYLGKGTWPDSMCMRSCTRMS